MKRVAVYLDDSTYDSLKREADAAGRSLSAIIRTLAVDHYGLLTRPPLPRRVEDLGFVGIGRSGQRPGDRFYPLSEHHDEALAEDVTE